MTSNFFKHNHKYVVLDNFKGMGVDFHKDEILTFNLMAYSRYDDFYAYEFIDNNGTSKSCWSKEIDEPTLIAHFRELDN